MISTLDFLYIVLGVGFIPVFILVCMILWRIFKMLDRIESFLETTQQIVDFTRNIDKIPSIIANKIISGFSNLLK